MIRPTTPNDSAMVTALAGAVSMSPEHDTEVPDTMVADSLAGNRERGHVCLIDEEDGEPQVFAYALPQPATEGLGRC